MVTGGDTRGALGGIQEASYRVDVGAAGEGVERGGEDVVDEGGEVVHRPLFNQPAVKLFLEIDLGLEFLGQ